MVSDELKDGFLHELWKALKRAGLSPDPNSIIGCKYVFRCDNGPILCGTITAIGVSGLMCIPFDLELYVGNPEVYRQKIRCITKMKGGWAIEVYTTSKKLADQFFYGELKLFFWPIPEAPDTSNRIFKSNP